jgi:hypothetical protein
MIELRPFQPAIAILDAALRRFLHKPGTGLAQAYLLFQGVAMKRKGDWINRGGCVPRGGHVFLCTSRAPERQPHAHKQRDARDYGSHCEQDFDIYGHVLLIGRRSRLLKRRTRAEPFVMPLSSVGRTSDPGPSAD